VKRLADLTAEDLHASPVWRYEGGTGSQAIVTPSKRTALSQADDEIFLAATDFELFDGSRHFGFCFPADDSGIDYLQPVILVPSGQVSFWFDGPASPETLARQWKGMGKEPQNIFPVAFRCLVPVNGRTVSGSIEGVASSRDLTSGPPAPAIWEETMPATDVRDAAATLAARPVQARRDTGPIEKRTARRRKAEMRVEFTQGALAGTGVIGDLSPRGMFVRSGQIPSPGPTVRLKVNLPEGRTLVLNGKVVRDGATASSNGTSTGFGLRLASDSPEYEDLLARLRDKPK
jgi:PilZ domain-containing protein